MRGSNSDGVGSFVALLMTIVFVCMKIGGATAWPWVWVVSPLWIVGLLVVLLYTYAVIKAISEGR